MDTTVFPKFKDLDLIAIEKTLNDILAQNLKTIDRLANNKNPTFETLLVPLEKMEDELTRFWSPISHLHAVCDSEALRALYERAIEALTHYSTAIGQNEKLYGALVHVEASPAFAKFTSEQKMLIKHGLRNFKLAGVSLPKEQRQRFAELQLKAAQLSTKFSQNVLDARTHWEHFVTDKAELAGVPEQMIAQFEQRALDKGKSGYCLSVDDPSYQAIITYADNARLRELIYKAYVTRASDQGEHPEYDNSSVILETLKVRKECAELLGFKNYAELSLFTKMAKNPDEALTFLEKLAEAAKPFAEKEKANLLAYAKKQHGIEKLNPWDMAYYGEKYFQSLFQFSQEELRPYFPLPKVLNGLFEIIHRLYEIRVVGIDNPETWHKDVTFFELQHKGSPIGYFYLDPYAREHKRGGAWMDNCQNRQALQDKVQLPIAYLTCNFRPPELGKPGLLTHDEVLTLFHEFGHGLHHMMTKMHYPSVSGINGVPWDAVELPSQIMENWCWEVSALPLISAHIETRAPVPQDKIKQLKASRNFHAALFVVRQLEFALFDLRLHKQAIDSIEQVQEILDKVRNEVSVFIPPAYNRFQHGFSHIFAGGYAAGYYSYLWAESLAVDAFGRFQEEGIFNPAVGNAFWECILSKGGAYEPLECFKAFRGCDPNPNALLKHYGLME